MANPSFVDALSALRRKAQLSGRPLTKQETAGAVAGYAETASERLARGRQLQLEQERLDLAQQTSDREYKLAKQQMHRDETTGLISTIATGASIGGGIGGVPGAAIGGAIGTVVGVISKACIIISACSGPDSYEVEVARVYRDNFMSAFELIGYYAIAPKVAPYIERHRLFKRLIKTQLVDRLVDYAEWLLELKPKMRHPIASKLTQRLFMKLCQQVGKRQFYRKGVVYDA